MSIFDEMDAEYDNFIEACEELFPDFKNKVEAKMKEKSNANLLQDERNLTNEIEAKCKLMNDLEDQMYDLKDECEELLKKMEDDREKIHELNATYQKLNNEMMDLENKRTEIHKQWIISNPPKLVSSTKKSDDYINGIIDNIIGNVNAANAGGILRK